METEKTLLKALELAHAKIETLTYELNEANHAYHYLKREKNRIIGGLRESTLEDIELLEELRLKLELKESTL